MPPDDKLEGTFRPDDKPKVSGLSTMLLPVSHALKLKDCFEA